MLPVAHRVTAPAEFRAAVRRGRRAAAPTLVAHLVVEQTEAHPPRVGFVVSKAVGNAVVRNRVQRRLRHLAAERVARLSPGSVLVVRATPAAAVADSRRLGADLDVSLRRLGITAASTGVSA